MISHQAAQHVFSLFDSQLPLAPNQQLKVGGENISAFQYQHLPSKGTLITHWDNEARPADDYESRRIDVTVKGSFKQPVFVDLITGVVYEIPKDQWKKSGNDHTFSQIVIPDFPVVIADKAVLKLK